MRAFYIGHTVHAVWEVKDRCDAIQTLHSAVAYGMSQTTRYGKRRACSIPDRHTIPPQPQFESDDTVWEVKGQETT